MHFFYPYNYKLRGVLPCQTPPPSFQDAPLKRLRTLSLDVPYKTPTVFDTVYGQTAKLLNSYFFF